jgi:hypothetical protein
MLIGGAICLITAGFFAWTMRGFSGSGEQVAGSGGVTVSIPGVGEQFPLPAPGSPLPEVPAPPSPLPEVVPLPEEVGS